MDCAFPQAFGTAVDSGSTDDGDLALAPTPLPPTAAPGPDPGITGGCSSRIADLSVVCRRFEITGVTVPLTTHAALCWQHYRRSCTSDVERVARTICTNNLHEQRDELDHRGVRKF